MKAEDRRQTTEVSVIRHPSSVSGMTLIEILMALAILTIAAGVLMTATSRCLNVVRTAKNYYEARRILEIGELDYPLLVVKKKGEKDLKPLNLNVGPVS